MGLTGRVWESLPTEEPSYLLEISRFGDSEVIRGQG